MAAPVGRLLEAAQAAVVALQAASVASAAAGLTQVQLAARLAHLS